MSIKKILFIITLSDWGGAQKNVTDLASAVISYGITPIVAAGGDADGKLFQRLNSLNIETHHLKNLTRELSPSKDFNTISEINNLIQTTAPDLVHLHSSKIGFLGRAACWKSKTPHIYTVHGFAFRSYQNQFKNRFFFNVEKLCSRITGTNGGMICVCREDYNLARQQNFYPENKLFYIPNGINSPIETPGKLKEINPNPGDSKVKIIFSGRLCHDKGLDLLIKALAKFLRSDRVALDIIGSGPEKQNYHKLIEDLRISSKVNFRGFLEYEDLLKHYQQSDLLIMPSRKEGFPYTILEAGSVGCPVVASSTGGIPELIINEKTGILIKSLSVNSIESAVNKALRFKTETGNLSSSKLGDLGIELKQLIQQKFNLEQMVTQTVNAYNAVTGSDNPDSSSGE